MAAPGDLHRPPTLPIIREIVEQHAEEAAFLWSLRDAATDQPHYTLRNLTDLEERVEAHIDGLRVAGEAGLEIAWEKLEEYGGPGELFAVATLSLEARSDASIERVVAFAEGTPESWRGLFGALGWLPAAAFRGRAVTWLDSSAPFRRLLGVVACSLHRADPRSRLDLLLEDEPLVRRRALRLAGELGRIDLGERLRPWFTADDEGSQFWAAWSAGLLGDRGPAIPVLQTFAAGDGQFKWRALDLVIRLMDRESAITWLRALGQHAAHARLLVVGTGILGDPTVVPWLIEKMAEPALARVAGESFSMITGVDLVADRLDGPAPPEFVAGPTDESGDEFVAMDPDENLPWPDSIKIREWWNREGAGFACGVRHLLGRPLMEERRHGLLQEESQRQRRAAAYELVLASPGQCLSNWRARSSVGIRGANPNLK